MVFYSVKQLRDTVSRTDFKRIKGHLVPGILQNNLQGKATITKHKKKKNTNKKKT